MFNNHRVFAQLQTREDFEKFLDGMMKENTLRDRIAELQELRANGLTSLSEEHDYLREKAARVRTLTHSLPSTRKPHLSTNGLF